jgi:ABC-type transport system involved in cytochrome bd biosynthesis fused ATPase/permease subunit
VLLAALVFLVLGAYESILPLSAGARSLRMCETAAGRLKELTDRPPAVEDPLAPRALPGAGSGGGEAVRTLRAEGLSFRYGAREPWVLRDATLELSRGERVALIGPSGAGKSTLAELLVRFNDPTDGRVSIDGVDIRALGQSEVRETVLLCDQDCHVFNTSIRENLLLARRDAGRREILHALAVVELAEWAAGLPQGLDTIVGRDGELLSGGQRRRLALARVLLSRAPFVILDEPAAHLDPALSRRVLANVLSVCDGRGLLVITHDTAGVQDFDRILEIRNGLLCEHEDIRRFAAAA